MEVKFSDGVSVLEGGPINVIRVGEEWHVVGRKYLCAVESEEEGKELVMLLKSARGGEEQWIGLSRDKAPGKT